MMDEHTKQALRTAVAYALFAGLSMPLADALLHGLVGNSVLRIRLIAWKDWTFVLVTASLVFFLARRTLRAYSRLLGELQRSELRFRTIFDGVGDGIFLCDPRTAAFIDANETMERMLGYTRKEMARLTFADVSADAGPAMTRRLRALLAGVQQGQAPLFEWHAKRRDGSLFWVEIGVQQGIIEGRPHVMALVRDITQRREVEEALRDSESRYRELFYANPHPMWAYDTETLRFLAVNDAAVRHYGYTREEFLAMSIEDIRPAEDVPALLENVRAVTSGIDEAGVWRHRLKNGSLIDVEIVSHVLAFDGHRAEVVLANDVTEQRRVEAEIRRLNAELEARVARRTAQLESVNKELDAFAYSVSHDLKAPLRRIDGYSRILAEDHADKLDEAAQGVLQHIHDGIAHMHRLIQDMLAYSRMERRTVECDVLAVDDLVRTVAAEREQEAQDKGASIAVAVPPLHVQADREGLAIVMRNLIGNALKFSRDADPPTIEIGGEARNGNAVVWVRDNGIGFDMQYHDRIFDMFQRLERVEDYGGTGVGLALVRKAVQRMGGRVWAVSEPGQGATFYVELPSGKPAATLAAAVATVAAATPPSATAPASDDLFDPERELR